MNTWNETTYQLTETDIPFVSSVPKQRRVMLSLTPYNHNGQGFTLCLTPAHIPVIEKLLAELYTVSQVKPLQPEDYRYSIEVPAF